MLDQFVANQHFTETPDEFRERCIRDGWLHLEYARPFLQDIIDGKRKPYQYVQGKGIVEYDKWEDKNGE